MMQIKKIFKREVGQMIIAPSADAHKGTQGHALVIGGSYGMTGSVCLSAQAALRAGSGLVSALIPECGMNIIQTIAPEVMAITAGEKIITSISFTKKATAIGIGPGLGQNQETAKAFHDFLKQNKLPLVVDADALNILSNNPEWLRLLPENTILTPHRKEMQRLLSAVGMNDKHLSEFCDEYKLIVVAKGAPTVIYTAGQSFENTSGNAALATAGSGDVLTGIIVGLLAQKYKPLEAAIIAVYVHGYAADLYVQQSAPQSFIASDIINLLGHAFYDLQTD